MGGSASTPGRSQAGGCGSQSTASVHHDTVLVAAVVAPVSMPPKVIRDPCLDATAQYGLRPCVWRMAWGVIGDRHCGVQFTRTAVPRWCSPMLAHTRTHTPSLPPPPPLWACYVWCGVWCEVRCGLWSRPCRVTRVCSGIAHYVLQPSSPPPPQRTPPSQVAHLHLLSSTIEVGLKWGRRQPG